MFVVLRSSGPPGCLIVWSFLTLSLKEVAAVVVCSVAARKRQRRVAGMLSYVQHYYILPINFSCCSTRKVLDVVLLDLARRQRS